MLASARPAPELSTNISGTIGALPGIRQRSRPAHSQILQLQPIPNPSLLPHPPFNSDVYPPLQALGESDAIKCILYARHHCSNISKHTETVPSVLTPCPLNISPKPSFQRSRERKQSKLRSPSSNTLAVLQAFMMKLGREGLRYQIARLVSAEGGQLERPAFVSLSGFGA